MVVSYRTISAKRTACCVGRGYDGQLVVWAVGMTADSLLCGPWV